MEKDSFTISKRVFFWQKVLLTEERYVLTRKEDWDIIYIM